MPTARPSSGEQPTSGRTWNEGARSWIQRVWQVDKGTGTTYIPPFKESTADGFFQKYNIQPGPADWETLSLDFVSSLGGGAGLPRDDGDSRWTLTAPTELVPLWQLAAAYRAKWDHNLYVPVAAKAAYSQPAWWTTAADLSDADGVSYLWAKDDPGDAWAKVEDKTKPGVEGFFNAAPVARYEYWNATKATAVAELETVGTLQTPTETFGYSGGTWLVTTAEVTEDSGKWRATVEYTYSATGWDTDIYS